MAFVWEVKVSPNMISQTPISISLPPSCTWWPEGPTVGNTALICYLIKKASVTSSSGQAVTVKCEDASKSPLYLCKIHIPKLPPEKF